MLHKFPEGNETGRLRDSRGRLGSDERRQENCGQENWAKIFLTPIFLKRVLCVFGGVVHFPSLAASLVTSTSSSAIAIAGADGGDDVAAPAVVVAGGALGGLPSQVSNKSAPTMEGSLNSGYINAATTI
jgi:hypothetical protein